MKIINSSMVESAADYNAWVDIIEESLKLERDLDFQMPVRSHIDFGENTLLLMPCIGSEYFVTKLVSVFPRNSNKGLPPLHGTVILNSSDTGEPLAVIDGSSLTAYRTAAVGSLGIRHLAPKYVSTLGIIGIGRQGLFQALFACSQRNFTTINIYDSSKKNMEEFSVRIKSEYPGIEVIACSNSEEVCINSEVLITATNSAIPVLPNDKSILKGKTYIGIGSYKPDMREFPDALFKLIDNIYLDTTDGMSESGDLIDPLKNGWLKRGQFVPANEMIRDDVITGHTKVFKSVGMALFDLYGAILVYRSNLNR